tara:strand:- start:50 stop:379 length:330 start_codon:yes stop_codon:yes gene_type:complete
MAFYENTIVAKQDLAEKELKSVISKYEDIINSASGKVIKTEEWGLISMSKKIKNYKKGFFIHYKFEGNNTTLKELNKKTTIDNSILRTLTVKYKKLDLKSEYFKEKKSS